MSHGCAKTYIGKTDRCLYTRLNEHAITDKNSEIYKHINTCEQFNYLTNLLQLNIDEPNTDQFDLTAFLLNNCDIIDRAKHWSNLLFKGALAIHRQKPRNRIMAPKHPENYRFSFNYIKLRRVYITHAHVI